MAPTLSTSHSRAFLALPLEIRRHIYSLCVPQNMSFDCSLDLDYQNQSSEWYDSDSESDVDGDKKDYPYYLRQFEGVPSKSRRKQFLEEDDYDPSENLSAFPGILLLCRQITDEVTSMLYGGNTFQVTLHGEGQSNLSKKFSLQTREKIRRILLVLRPMGISCKPGFSMDPTTWNSTLDGLSILGIIAEQPEPETADGSPYGSPQVGPPSVLPEWETWVTTIVEFLSHTVSDTTKIVVDANKKRETENIFNKIIPGRCEFTRLRRADFIFKRGVYSPESGYWDWYDEGPTSCRDIISDRDYDYYYSD